MFVQHVRRDRRADFGVPESMASHKKILITGGAGFIGSHLADELLNNGYQVRALDMLSAQVHGTSREAPGYLDPDVEVLTRDVRDPAAVERALRGVDAVFHFAASVGVGQSMYEIEKYTSHNSIGTAVLLEALSKQPVEKLIVASSMSIYGEGLYRRANGKIYDNAERTLDQLKRGVWELLDGDGNSLEPIATPESKPPALNSVY